MHEKTSYPLSDCVDGVSHPVETLTLYGHDENLKTLDESLKVKRFHHGWIFSGPHGVGKATLCYHVTRALIGGGLERLNAECDFMALSRSVAETGDGKLLASFAHPNVKILRRAYDEKTKKFKRFITIDDVRSLKTFLHTTPAMGDKRVVIIDRAEDMNEASSNALLKMLEEPPDETCFFLITGALGSLPITIRSRCRILKFDKLDRQDFEKALKAQFGYEPLPLPQGLGPQDLYHLAGGSVAKAFELLSGRGFEFYQLLLKIFVALPQLDQVSIDKFVDGVVVDKTGQDYQGALQLMDDLLQRLIKGYVADQALSEGEKVLALKLMPHRSVEQWLGLWDTLNSRRRDVDELNLDKKSFLMQSIFELRQMAQ